jgi:hypothetical protein
MTALLLAMLAIADAPTTAKPASPHLMIEAYIEKPGDALADYPKGKTLTLQGVIDAITIKDGKATLVFDYGTPWNGSGVECMFDNPADLKGLNGNRDDTGMYIAGAKRWRVKFTGTVGTWFDAERVLIVKDCKLISKEQWKPRKR